jgi:hypothetical protein
VAVDFTAGAVVPFAAGVTAFAAGVAACAAGGLALAPRARRVITPVDSTRRVVLMALERGKLAELLADGEAMASHRAMAAVLGVVLELPPVKRALASRQLRSRYLDALLARHPAAAG